MEITRRKLLVGGALALGGIGTFSAVRAASEIEEVELRRVEVRIPFLPETFDGLRLTQISDLHIGNFITPEYIGRVVDLANATAADVVVITGDFIDGRGGMKFGRERIESCARELRRLMSRYGSFGVLGNHDYATRTGELREALLGAGVELLQNRARPIEADGKRLWMAGVDDALLGRPDLDRALATLPKQEPSILLAHEPDLIEEAAHYGIGLQLSGHSHGGQVQLPLTGPVYLPPLSRRFPEGMYRVGNSQLYTNRGVGVTLVPLRLNCPPEITVFTLRR